MTTYHIRKLRTHFDTNVGVHGYSNNNILEDYDEPLLGDFLRVAIRTKPNDVFNTTTQEFFYIDILGDRAGPPSLPTIEASDIHKVTSSDGYFYWSSYNVTPQRQSGWLGTRWTSYGWGDPETQHSTFVGNLCSQFNTLRAGSEESQGDNWNLYVFEYSFNDSPIESYGNYIYFPLFTKGNDPNYDSIITI